MEESNVKAHLRMLMKVALSDRKFSAVEKGLILSIGKAHKVKEETLDELMKEELSKHVNTTIEFNALSFDEKFGYLYDIIQLMKIDNEVYLSEIKFCEEMADHLGFHKKVVKSLSARIFADPSITADRNHLMKEAQKFLKD